MNLIGSQVETSHGTKRRNPRNGLHIALARQPSAFAQQHSSKMWQFTVLSINSLNIMFKNNRIFLHLLYVTSGTELRYMKIKHKSSPTVHTYKIF